ncbi:MAG: type II secretion system F family protein [Corynebacteriales bacterium]|nr:type II secretion system F family protein [Mycobacteriales bacterium]
MNALFGARRRAMRRLPHGRRSQEHGLRISTAGQYLLVIALSSAAGLCVSIIAGVLTAIYTMWARDAWLRHQRALRQQVAEVACADAFAGLAADIRAGATPANALTNAVKGLFETTKSPFWLQLIAAAESTRVIVLLRRAPAHYRECCQRLAAAWQLIEAGITLAPVLDSLETELRGRIEHRQRVAADTAGAKATAAVLLSLPIVGILFGYALGADSLHVLLLTMPGAGCALIGVCLQYGGWYWANKLSGPSPTTIKCDRGRSPKARLHSLRRASTMSANDSPSAFTHALPYAAELFAATISAGAPTSRGAALVGKALPGPAGGWFTDVARKLQTGMSPTLAWRKNLPTRARRWPWSVSQASDPLVALAQDIARASDSGAALTRSLRTHARTLRRTIEQDARIRAARANVALVLPLVCCFLPAFVLIGVIPLLIDLLRQGLGSAL